MQVTVTIPDELAAQAQSQGLSPERYIEQWAATPTGPAAQADRARKLAQLEIFFAEMAADSQDVPLLPDKSLHPRELLPGSRLMSPMDKERILATLREHEPELKAAGLLHLRLFGSVARGDDTPASDIDLLFDFDESQGNILRAYGFQDRVTKTPGVEAHLRSSKHMRPYIRERVDRELVHVF